MYWESQKEERKVQEKYLKKEYPIIPTKPLISISNKLKNYKYNQLKETPTCYFIVKPQKEKEA